MRNEIEEVLGKLFCEEHNGTQYCSCDYWKNKLREAIQSSVNKRNQELLQIVIEDVPHRYQKRLLEVLNG